VTPINDKYFFITEKNKIKIPKNSLFFRYFFSNKKSPQKFDIFCFLEYNMMYNLFTPKIKMAKRSGYEKAYQKFNTAL
jgi:hypothetical protein